MIMKLRDHVEIHCYVPDCKGKVIVYFAGELTGELHYYCLEHGTKKIESDLVKENSKKDEEGTLQNLLS